MVTRGRLRPELQKIFKSFPDTELKDVTVGIGVECEVMRQEHGVGTALGVW